MRLNDHERELWVLNDAYLYSILNVWKRDRRREKRSSSMREFLREKRGFIDRYILNYSSVKK